MTIKIEKAKKDGYKDTVKLSRLLPFEYVIACKTFSDPISGTAKMPDGATKTWNLYTLNVEEFMTNDPSTGDKITEKPNDEFGYFANTDKLHEKLVDIPVNVRFKIRVDTIKNSQGSTFTEFMVDILDDVSDGASNTNKAPEKTLEERVKAYKKEGVSKEDTIRLLSSEFDVSDDIIGGKYDAV